MVWMEETRGKRKEIVLEAIEERVDTEKVGGSVAYISWRLLMLVGVSRLSRLRWSRDRFLVIVRRWLVLVT